MQGRVRSDRREDSGCVEAGLEALGSWPLTPGSRSNAEVQAACWLAHSLDRRTQISAHSRESGNPGAAANRWVPAFAGTSGMSNLDQACLSVAKARLQG